MGKKDVKMAEDQVFDYLPPPVSMRANLSEMSEESAGAKFFRKFKSQPLIPIGRHY